MLVCPEENFMRVVQLWELRTDDLFSIEGELATYRYYGKGWYGRPYSGGPWHSEESRCVFVEALRSVTLRQLLENNWPNISTRNQLKQRLVLAARILWILGHRGIADRWFARLANMSDWMSKEAINVVLLAAWNELCESGADLDRLPSFDSLLTETNA
jgi:hypothetical protein